MGGTVGVGGGSCCGCGGGGSLSSVGLKEGIHPWLSLAGLLGFGHDVNRGSCLEMDSSLDGNLVAWSFLGKI